MIAADLLVLLLAVIGAYVVARAVVAWSDSWRIRRDWARSTEYVVPGPRLAGEPEAAWDGIEAAVTAEPDTYHPRCGIDDDLLKQCRDLLKNSPGGEEK